MTVTVSDVPANSRFEAHVNGELAGFAEYIRSEGLIVFPNTVVEIPYEGLGVGGALARTALDSARAWGLPVIATCPFIKGWMIRHPEYLDLVYQNPGQAAE